MKKLLLFMILSVVQLASATETQVRVNRIISEIDIEVTLLTAVQKDSIGAAATLYFSALQEANLQYANDNKTRIQAKINAETIFLESVQTILTQEQWQQWTSRKQAKQKEMIEQYKN